MIKNNCCFYCKKCINIQERLSWWYLPCGDNDEKVHMLCYAIFYENDNTAEQRAVETGLLTDAEIVAIKLEML